jgi:tetratricopeptide (TPR) repeat protein
MTNEHLTDEALADLALTPGASDPHVAHCVRCTKALEDFAVFTALLSDDVVWQEEAPQTLMGGEKKGLAEIQAVASRLEEESLAAQDLGSRIFEHPDQADGILRFAPATAGALAAALEAARRLLDTAPARALEVTCAAEALARRVDWTTYPTVITAEHRGHIFKERANALRLLGRFTESLEAVGKATLEYERSLASAHSVAVVEYIAACVLREQDDFTAALRRLKSAVAVFADFGDDTRELHCRILEGVILSETGQRREGRAVFLELLRSAQDDLPARAQLHNNIGVLSIELEDLDLGATHLLQAMHLYRELGMLTERTRSKWALARILLKNGKLREGIDRLREVESEFLAAGMQLEAALVALDRIEAHLGADESAEATSECRSLYARFNAAGVTANALTALAFLQESASRDSNPKPAVKRVRSFLERLPNEPDLLFASPPEG